MSDSTFLRHDPCEACGSSDANAVYSNGWAHCFACNANVKWDQDEEGPAPETFSRPQADKSHPPLAEGDFAALPARGITEETCRKFGYRLGTYPWRDKKTKETRTEKVHIAPLYKNGTVVAQKLRNRHKDFKVVGNPKDLPLFGMNLWNSGKILVITEGEIDAMSVAQVQGLKFPAVSIPNGAQAAAKSLALHLDYLRGFEKIVLMFDMDEPGQLAAIEAAEVLPPGKAFIASLPLKDANECLMNGKSQEIVAAMWQARPYRPDGIVSITDIKDELFAPVVMGTPWPWPRLTELTFGRRYGELYGFGAGVGVGKTDVFTQCIEYDVNVLQEPVGVIYLEQPVKETVQRVAGKMKRKLFHIPNIEGQEVRWTDEEYREAVDELEATGRLWLYRHFGSMDWDTIQGKIRFFNKSLGIRHIYLDHLTALSASADDERRCLDKVMAEMASLAQELGIIIHFISHLTTPEGKPHEEGGRVMEKHFTGSRAIARWAHYMFGLERDKQAEDPEQRKTTTFRILKDRYTGQSTGCVFFLKYDTDTGFLSESEGFTAGEDGTPFDPSDY